jgi:hypothetical protein
MKTLKYSILFVFGLSVAFTSCDVIDDPVIPVTTNYRENLYGPAPEFDLPTEPMQYVLIEDFTAHQCGNCPDAGVIAENIIDNYEEAILVAIHAGNLAAVNDQDPFATNWVTEEGQVYWDQLDFQANPLGRVNREGGTGNFFAPTQWEDKTLEWIANDPSLQLQIQTDYVGENNDLNIHVHGTFWENVDNNTHLVVLITESELYDYQLWYGNDPEVVPDYHFKHTLRGSVTGASGLSFAGASEAGATVQKDYTFSWPNDWVLENCYVVAFVYDDETGLVLNAIEADL